MTAAGSGGSQDAPVAAGVSETPPHRLGEFRFADIVRTAGEKEDAAVGGHRSGKPSELAIAAQCRRHLLARPREGGGIGDDEVEALSRRGEPGSFAKHLAAPERADLADPVTRC